MRGEGASGGIGGYVRYAAFSVGVRLLPVVGAIIRKIDPYLSPIVDPPTAPPVLRRADNENGDGEALESAAA